MSFNLHVMLSQQSEQQPDKPFLLFADMQFTYAQTDAISASIAASLSSLGLAAGDRVAVQLPNIPQFVFTYFALLRAGLVMVPMNPLLKGPEVAHHLRDSGARLLISFELFAEEAAKGIGMVDAEVAHFVVAMPGSDQRPAGGRDFDELYFAEPMKDVVQAEPHDTAVIIYTSGTTGRPKGAELTHFQLYMNCTVAAETTDFRPEDVGLAVLPLFHVFGLSTVLNTCVRYGGTVVLMPRFDVTDVLDAMERHRVTIFAGVPTMYTALLQADISGRDLSMLRFATSGGAAMPGEVLRAFEEKFGGAVVLEGYGMSETASAATFNRADDRRELSIGKPMWGVEIRIVDESGEPLPRGTGAVGELLIRGHNVMKGYFNNSEATAAALEGGWLHTGDLGYADEDGFFFIVDRKKDLVIRGGYNVYPREIEEVLFAHPAVVEAAVIGIPDDRLGEEVVAYVTCRPDYEATAGDLIAYCKEQLAAYKYPRLVYVIDELPKGPTGKILKAELRAAPVPIG